MPTSDIAEGSQPDARVGSAIQTLSESTVQYGLMAYAFLLPFAKLNHVLEYSFLALVIVWVALKASRRTLSVHLTALGVPILLFLGWVLLTTAFAVDPAYSFSEWRKSATRVVMLFFVASAITDERQVRNIVIALVLGCLVQAAGAVFGSLSLTVPRHTIQYREGGWTSASQWLSTYLIMVLPFVALAFRFERRLALRWGYALGAILILIALLFSETRAAWAALLVQLAVVGTLSIKRSGAAATVAGALALGLVMLATAVPGPWRDTLMSRTLTNTSTMELRFNTWKLAVEQIAARPITGLGYGRHSFQHVIPEDPPQPLHTHVHNTFLSSAVQLGLPGFALLFWIFGRLLRECFHSWRANADGFEGQLALAVLLSVAGVIVRNFFDDMFVGTIVYLFWLLVGLHFVLKRGPLGSSGPVREASKVSPKQ